MSGFKKSLGMFDIIALAFGAMVGWGWVVLAGVGLLPPELGGDVSVLIRRYGGDLNRCYVC